MYGTLGLFAWTLEVIGVLTGLYAVNPADAKPSLILTLCATSATCFVTASEFTRRERREMQFEKTKNWAYYLFLLQAILSSALALTVLPNIQS